MKQITSLTHWSNRIRFACLLSALFFAPSLVNCAFAASPPSQDSAQAQGSVAQKSTDQPTTTGDANDQSSSGDSVDQPSTDDSSDKDSSEESAEKKPTNYNSSFISTKGGFMTSIARRGGMLGDMWGLRQALGRDGITLAILETSEALGNAAGGVNQGPEYDGLTQMILQLDTQRAFGWYGGTFNISGLQIHGSNLSALNLSSLQTASGIEADRATRLWELWYDQKFGHEGKFDLKLGQQSLDQEFMVSNNALLFVNTMFGWPMLPSADMPGGGPAYPLSALGVRARGRIANPLTVLAGVFSGTPVANTNGDSQLLNSSGTSFPISGALAIAELQYSYPSLGAMVRPNRKEPMPRIYRLGVWYDTKQFADQRFDNTGLSLANPASTGIPQSHRGDYALYAVADQMFWKDPRDDDRTLNFFVRAMGTPLSDRNLIDFSLNSGVTLYDPILHRDDDAFGVGMGYAHVSGQVAALDRDTGLFTGSAYPIRSGETFVEVTYRYQYKVWWQWQPTFQYVFNPGAGLPNPNSSSNQRIKGEPVFGLRMNFAF